MRASYKRRRTFIIAEIESRDPSSFAGYPGTFTLDGEGQGVSEIFTLPSVPYRQGRGRFTEFDIRIQLDSFPPCLFSHASPLSSISSGILLSSISSCGVNFTSQHEAHSVENQRPGVKSGLTLSYSLTQHSHF